MSRTITAAAFVSLDGVMQAPGGPTEDPTGGFADGGWLFRFADEGIFPTIGALFAGDYDLLLGRRTYDIFAAYWPYVEGDEAPMGEAFTRADKYVLTRGEGPLEWANSHRLAALADVAALKAQDGPPLIIQGSSTLYPPLLAAGLIDRMTLMTFPVLLGRGKRLLGEGTGTGTGAGSGTGTMRLVEHTVTDKGTVIATYAPGGPLPPARSGGPEPATSEREAARQAAMAGGTW